MKKILNFIDGEYVAGKGDRYIESYNPSIGEPHLMIVDSDERDVEDAVRAAKRVFPEWSGLTAQERSIYLNRIADLVDQKREQLALAESADQGKPVWLAEAMDITRVALNFRFFAGAILHDLDEAAKTNTNTLSYVSRKPVGVAGLITPWNLPLYLLTWKIAPAIAYGNTVVCKPSELTSHTAFLFCEILSASGLPNGVVNMVFGTGPRAGLPLVSHPDVPLISFTGGTATGSAIARVAAPLFKKTSLELGGKNPTIIFDDANLDEAVENTIRSSFLNQGEICLCGSRIYVQKKIYDGFLEKFVSRVKELKVGDPKERETFMGPLVSREHLAKVENYVRLAVEGGGRVLTGGTKPELEGKLKHGFFFLPTVIADVKHESRIQQEEVFGPVVTVTPFDSEIDVLKLANGTGYGLSAVVWTESLARAHHISEALDVGTVWVNTWMLRDLRMPFGGAKNSGVGREGQEGSRDFFTEAKTICMRY